MIDTNELWAEIELEHQWRQDEIRLFQNRIAVMSLETERDQFRRALVLLLYAHFEGFCKFAFSLYIKAINAEAITCSQANYALAAASLDDLFRTLRNPDKKCPEFKRDLPDDKPLHRFARDREFVERSREFEARSVSISDKVVDTESNLKPVVLRKILYRLGLPYQQFDNLESQIHLLLNYRNNIGHGEWRRGVTREQYNEVKNAVYMIMATVKEGVMSALMEKRHLRVI